MHYYIEKKGAFSVLGVTKQFTYQETKTQIPLFWQKFAKSNLTQYIHGMFGISFDLGRKNQKFTYMIADPYNPLYSLPDEKRLVLRLVPALNWAIFKAKGPVPTAVQELHDQIFTDWLPHNSEYRLAANYLVELYYDPSHYPKGGQDENYEAEIWVPIRKIK